MSGKITQTTDVASEIERKVRGNASSNVLQFDPTTGELLIVKPGTVVNPDATTVDQIATDGFA